MADVIDIDSHVYEPPAIWEDFVPETERAAAKAAFHHSVDARGNGTTVLNGAPAKELNRSKIIRQAVWHPGMSVEDVGGLDPEAFHPLNPGASDPKARLRDLDAMGVAQQVVFPTLFGEYLPQVVDEAAAVSLARAYNDWVWDFASEGEGRLHPVAVLPLQRPDLALVELERAAAKGFGSVMFRPSFYKLENAEGFGGGLAAMMGAGNQGPRPVFIEDKPYRVVWEKAAELDLVACVHPFLGITGPDAISSGAFTERVSSGVGAVHTVAEPIAYMQDADLFVTAALFHGLLEDLPQLKLAILHAGCSWVPLALEKCETYLWLGGMGSVPVSLEPEEVWERHPLLVSFDSWEKAVARMPDVLGGKAAWGSRYPNHDAAGPEEPRAMLADQGVDQSTVDALLGGHAKTLFGLQ
jgi:predicted TIM-barrel fold metal-dependent hydrolase